MSEDIIRRIDRAIYEVRQKGADAVAIEFSDPDYDLFRQSVDPMFIGSHPMPPSYRGIEFRPFGKSQVVGRFAGLRSQITEAF